MKIAITGGIGSGKSFVCRLLEQRGFTVYDSDQAAKRLIRTSPDIREKLTALIGPDTYQDAQLNKAVVTRFLLQSEENAKAINDIVHPAVFQDFADSGAEWMECAILFESGMNRLVDQVVVVTAPEEVRIQRVMQRDGISRDKVIEWMGRQWPQDEVVRRADYEIVNDGQQALDIQIDQLLERLSINTIR